LAAFFCTEPMSTAIITRRWYKSVINKIPNAQFEEGTADNSLSMDDYNTMASAYLPFLRKNGRNWVFSSLSNKR
jgi:hypothetical protein